MDRVGPVGAGRGRDGGDLIDRIVRAALIQVRAAGGLLHKARPVPGHVQRPVLFPGRRAGDAVLVGVQFAALERDQAVDSVIAVQFVPAAGERVFAVQAVRGPVVAVGVAVSVGAGGVGVPDMVDHAVETVESRVLGGRARIVVQPHFGLRIGFLDDPADAQIRVFGERIAGGTAIVVPNRGHGAEPVGHPVRSPADERERRFISRNQPCRADGACQSVGVFDFQLVRQHRRQQVMFSGRAHEIAPQHSRVRRYPTIRLAECLDAIETLRLDHDPSSVERLAALRVPSAAHGQPSLHLRGCPDDRDHVVRVLRPHNNLRFRFRDPSKVPRGSHERLVIEAHFSRNPLLQRCRQSIDVHPAPRTVEIG